MTTTIRIGNEDWPVNFGFGALREFERTTGKSIMNGALDQLDIDTIGTLLHVGIAAGLRITGDSGRKTPDVLFILDNLGMRDMPAITATIQSFFPESEVETDKKSEDFDKGQPN